MNPRIELFIILAILAGLAIFVLKSKWFDRKISWLLQGTNSTTVEDLKDDKARYERTKEKTQKELDTEAARIQAERREIRKL